MAESNFPDCPYCAQPIKTTYLMGEFIVYWCGDCGEGVRVKYDRELLPNPGD